jgi:hypothetical protein
MHQSHSSDPIQTIEVTVDKSHIVTIGERLYSEAMELIRELINNAYDADATEVHVTLQEDRIVIKDDGGGMDLTGLKQYFNIGSTAKRRQPKSPKFNRDRIGEFGIGKFASLAACSCFEVWTKRGDFQAKVTFDKEEWNRSTDRWHIPLAMEEADHRFKDGTKVTLVGVSKRFNLTDLEKYIREAVPLKAPDFTVYLNDHKVNPKFIPGHKIPFLEGTDFGSVYGEIIISSSAQQDISDAGIECKVKQVTITREFFGLDQWFKNISRIKGEVNADFLTVTSDRGGFIKDTPQYEAFQKAMERVVEKIRPVIEDLSDYKENKRVRRTLTEVLDKVRNALIVNPDYCPEGLMPLGDEASDGMGQPGYAVQKKHENSAGAIESKEQKTPQKKKKRKRGPTVKRLSPTAVVKRMKFGQEGINCCIDHFGPDGSECLTEGTTIYINRDHPLYQKESRKKDTYILHLARLLTQEICLMKDPRNPRQAFQRQSKLLQDALIQRENNS